MTETTQAQPEFDVLKTLYVIENDPDLNKIFKKFVPSSSYNTLYSIVKNGKLELEIVENLKEIYNIILSNKKMLEKYGPIKSSTRRSKYYGKKKLLDDISNGEKTEVDRALLALNDLLNTVSKLRSRCIRDKEPQRTKKILTAADYRAIVGIVNVLNAKVKPILLKN